MSSTVRTSSRVLGVASLVLGAFWVTVMGYVLHATFPFNPVKLPDEAGVNARLWSPQGWKFFTRSPREDWLLPFRRADDGWQRASLGPNARFDAYFGISRAPRAQGIEIGLLLHDVEKGMWDKCTDDPVRCLERSPIKRTLRNKTPQPTLCGLIGFALQEQVPWAWAYSRATPPRMPSRIAKFEVKC